MGELTPIVAGAAYRDVSCGETHGDVIRVKSVWVDEDANTKVQVFTEDEYDPEPAHRTIDLDDLLDQINDTLVRTNSDHEAWEWRN